jgi:predicted nucleic acid-binding protein
MNEVFADSFYFLALLNQHDPHHALAVEAARSLKARLVTTHWVIVEVADALSAPRVRDRVVDFIDKVSRDPNTVVITDLAPWFQAGLELYANRADKSWSLTDCISFAVMRSRGVGEALTGDHHFEQAGFKALLAPSNS